MIFIKIKLTVIFIFNEVYSLQAAGYARIMIKSIIGEYIKEIREECGEAYQFEQEFAYEKNF